MLINAMRGLGDTIFQRAFIKKFPGAYVDTPFPQLLDDLDIKPVRPSTNLRTQRKSMELIASWFHRPAQRELKIRYGKEGIISGMTESFGVDPGEFDLPDFGSSPAAGEYVVVRPVTVREEWRADTRNPLPEYVDAAARYAHFKGLKVVSIADLEVNKEWLIGDAPYADITYHSGELDVTQLMALIAGAKAVIGGIGWIVPATICYRVPAWIICGGQGGYNAPEKITSPLMGEHKTEFVVPDNFCHCTLKMHDCDKRISNYDARFAEWLDRLLTVE